MTKTFILIGCICIAWGCNNNQSKKPKVDTTPALSQTNNSLETLVDTLGFHSDSATNKYEKGSNLITQSDCLGCHKTKEASIGPSYVAIADKYSGSKQDIDRLTNAIIKGSKGVWGDVPMAAHPAITKEDATEMVNYILSLKNVQ